MANLLNQRLNEEDNAASNKKQKKVKPVKTASAKPKKVKSERIKPAKTKTEKIKPKKQEEIIEEQKLVQADFDEQIEAISASELKQEERKLRSAKRNFFLFRAFMCLGCAYMLFLIYGVIVTNYDYDKNGNVTAQTMTVNDIKAQKEFSNLLGYYKQSRALYEKVLLLDYRLAEGEEDAITLASEYKVLLDEASTIIVQLEALQVSKSYSQVYNLLLHWTKTDICVYLQNVSDAIAENNYEKANEAIINKETSYNDFYQATANMISLGERTKGIDVTDLKEWSPEAYIEKETGK